jgi:cytochrome c biogenesis protein CcdA
VTRTAWLAPLLIVLCAVTIGAQSPPPPATLEPLLEHQSIAAGTTLRAALRVSLPEGLHANSNKPNDPNLIPMLLTITPPAGVTVEEIVYPEASDLEQEGSDKPLRVFEREFVIGVVMKFAPDVAAGVLSIPARLQYQACDDKMCYRPLRIPSAWDVTVSPTPASAQPQYPAVFRAIRFGTGEKPAAALTDSKSDPRSDPGAARSPTPLSADEALAALDRFEIVGTEAGYLNRDEFLRFIRNAETGVVEKGWFEGRGPVAIVLVVLLGGLALNLTPCVLPMIPINLAIIGAGAQAGSRRRGFLLGASYGGAMALVYGVLGLIVILTAGTFGTINSSPWFNAAIAALFVVLALAMFDVISIDFSSFSSRFRIGEGSRGTFVLAFTLGALAALLAGACVAPVVIQVVLFASNLYATGTSVALALPFLLGLGMAIPWPIAGAGIAALPKPGPWMVRVKQAFGIFILATAAYYGYLSYELFANRFVDASEVQSSVAEKLKEGWQSDLATGLAVAQEENKPVLIDLWATWCKSCLTMDKTTLRDPEVSRALANYVKVKFQAENPDEAPTRDVMRRFKAIGLPTYVILQPRSRP